MFANRERGGCINCWFMCGFENMSFNSLHFRQQGHLTNASVKELENSFISFSTADFVFFVAIVEDSGI